ncbi:hypothetical protein [Vibrio tapetis]|nr:hypothetical protein [Vibrio tapetis]
MSNVDKHCCMPMNGMLQQSLTNIIPAYQEFDCGHHFLVSSF